MRRRTFVMLLGVGAVAACTAPAPAPAPANFVVYFQTGGATLGPDARQIIANAVAAAKDRPDKLLVEGHADGGATTDAALADRRALAVIRALTDAGLDAGRITKAQGTPAPGEEGVAAHQVLIRFVPPT
ncbi:MAG TPA: OmpA family protein [Stellaceae bacterium]|nr:OmpA family protein [Stellaceae bacterium]